jgi:pyruvate dehydrogenase E2 component (dihydrolipoamide acetyltransferase)
MITEMVLPELGENIESGIVATILIKVGDQINVEEPVIEIETDKAVVEVPSDVSGLVTAIFVKEGEEIRIGQKMVSIDTDSPGIKSEETREDKESKEDEESSSEVLTGEPAFSGQPGFPAQPGSSSQTGLILDPKPPAVSMPVRNGNGNSEMPGSQSPFETVAPAAPSVRRFAREIGLKIDDIPGSGPGGRISIEDVKVFSRSYHSTRSDPKSGKNSLEIRAGVRTEPLPDFTKWGTVERVSMSMVRRKTASHLGYAWATIPQVTQFGQADITDLENFRKEHATTDLPMGVKLTMTSILMKIIAGAMKVFPHFNASIDMEKNEIIYKRYFHIGVAVDTKRGLLVPVIRDVDRMNLIDISIELNRLAQMARDKKLSLADMHGGNFTISNLGGICGTAFTPIVNPPEVAILGVSRSQLQPRYIKGQLEPRLMLPLSLSYDHRLIDGADGARFLKWICQAIAQPLLLALEG